MKLQYNNIQRIIKKIKNLNKSRNLKSKNFYQLKTFQKITYQN